MKVNSRNNEGLRVRDNMVEEVESFIYLGHKQRSTEEQHWTSRSGQHWRMEASTSLTRSGVRNFIRKTKATLFKTLVLSGLLYGCETWKMTKGEEKKLEIFQAKCFRRIFCIRWQQHVPNKGMAGADPISEEVRRKRWCWIGHVLRKEVSNDCAVALGWKSEGKRSRCIVL